MVAAAAALRRHSRVTVVALRRRSRAAAAIRRRSAAVAVVAAIRHQPLAVGAVAAVRQHRRVAPCLRRAPAVEAKSPRRCWSRHRSSESAASPNRRRHSRSPERVAPDRPHRRANSAAFADSLDRRRRRRGARRGGIASCAPRVASAKPRRISRASVGAPRVCLHPPTKKPGVFSTPGLLDRDTKIRGYGISLPKVFLYCSRYCVSRSELPSPL